MESASWVGILKHGSDKIPMPKSREKWLLSKILQDGFFDREPVSGASSTERADQDDMPFSLTASNCFC